MPAELDRLCFEIISEYLGPIQSLKSLDRVCRSANGHVKNSSDIRFVMRITGDKKYMMAAKFGIKELVFEGIALNKKNMKDIFINICKGGHLELAKQIKNIYVISDDTMNGLYNMCCEYKDTNILQWLLEHKNVRERVSKLDVFYGALNKNNIYIAEWALSQYFEIPNRITEYCYRWLNYKYYDSVRWLYKNKPKETGQELGRIYIMHYDEQEIRQTIENLMPNLDMYYASLFVRGNENLSESDWYDIFMKIKSDEHKIEAFNACCKKDKLDLSKIMYSHIKDVSSLIDMNQLFIACIESRAIKVLRWLYESKFVSVDTIGHQAIMCLYTKFDVCIYDILIEFGFPKMSSVAGLNEITSAMVTSDGEVSDDETSDSDS